MSSADNPTEPSVTTGETSAAVTSTPRPRFKRQLILIIAVGVVLLAVAGIGYYVWHTLQHKAAMRSQATTGQSAVSTAEAQANNGDTNAALSTLGTAIKDTNNKSQIAALYVQQGVTYTDDQNYSAALQSYLQAEQTNGLTYSLAQSIAEAAQASGNKQLAITYFQKAINLVPANDPTGGAEKNIFQLSINSLGGK